MFAMMSTAFVLGIAIAMPPGAVSISGNQRAVTKGFWNAFTFYAGVVTADTLYALVVYFGLSALVKDSVAFKLVLWGLGGAWLIWMGIGAIRTRIDLSAATGAGLNETRQRVYLDGLLITLFNPLTVVGWIALAGNFFETVWRPEWPAKDSVGLFAILIILLGVQSWSLGVAAILSRLRKMISPRLLRWVSVISGLFLVGYGLTAWRSALALLMGGQG